MTIPSFLLQSSILLLAQGVNEITWRNSIQTDINNGAPAEAICRNAMSSAQVSDDVPFKNWAYGIARNYCQSGDTSTPQPSGSRPASPTCPPITLLQQQSINAGKRVAIKGGDCQMIFNGTR